MLINKAIAKLMKDNEITQKQMALMIGKKRPNDISSRLLNASMTVNKVIEMLSVMGYELVVQKTTSGSRSKDQIVIDRSDLLVKNSSNSIEDDIDKILKGE